MSITTDQVQGIINSGGNVVNEEGHKLGGIGQIYLDDSTGEPTWVTVKTGLFGSQESFVPLEQASVDGSDIRVRYDKDTIKDAPRVDADRDLSPDEEKALYSHYGLGGAGGGTGDRDAGVGQADAGVGGVGDDRAADRDVSDRDRTDAGVADREDAGQDVSGSNTDGAMTRSEEQLKVGKQTQESGRARLRKYVVTENVTQTVPVQHEEVRVEREPITDANRGAAEEGPGISEEEHEVTLHEERPVVEKEAVPVERVRVGTETVTDEATVSDEVRKEQIDTDADDDRTRGAVGDDRTRGAGNDRSTT